MEFLIAFDFYSQTVQGLKNEIKSSGFDNIDIWEDLKEDLNAIESYFFSSFDLKIISKNLLKIKTKYLIRIIVESPINCDLFYKLNKEALKNKAINGWAPFSIRGCAFKFVQIDKEFLHNAEVFNDQIKNFKPVLNKVKSISLN